ncbi:LysM peptidoglycan-binding domain-containing protein [Kribbella sp. NPDC003557]|jgi:LysM repeat protein|uniref:LysM peptidoglycan-binding domain-containing protein n=1 Tax=Kribbella sp. NPDC003557 TaxID=3154449 RepID=UPI0033B3536F
MSTVPWMADAFRSNGLKVLEVTGWKTRGRPGTFEPRGVVFHHTASGRNGGSAPSIKTVLNGRPGIPGPLCQVLIGRDLTVRVIAAGRANHAGLGGPIIGIPKDSGNSFLIGVEVENDGVGETWTPGLLQTCDTVFATLLLGLRRQPAMLIGHKEWAPKRKIDPARTNAGLPTMDQVRARVTAKLRTMGHPDVRAASSGIHVVKAGDTLFRIALQHRMSVAELMKLNNLKSTLIKPGQKLKVRR